MDKISLYQNIFSDLESPVEDLRGDVSDNKLRSTSLKFESDIPKLERMCYIMEQVVLKKKVAATVYAGFQKISRARAIWDRFLKIADNVDKVYIFGEKDDNLKSHPNIEFIYLPKRHPLIREWFLVIDQPLAKSMMVAYDLDGFGIYKDEKKRNFKGAKSAHPRVVAKAKDILDKFIESY
ncbi:histidine kinase [Orenia metallireducens]|jgi:DICT domain-containing protein|uniref:Histidine kinase n=1 Tax=Orenia metallireducens TaxID=1413210 RepID=A0A1C0A7N7_9FIRM|nr:DICT sensory domain-containing protein [Orenia metallireducens]OCL26228.1 histidine kinase [Orenia metallireducens]